MIHEYTDLYTVDLRFLTEPGLICCETSLVQHVQSTFLLQLPSSVLQFFSFTLCFVINILTIQFALKS